MPIGPGTKLGQYEVQDFIGQGAMGVVYRAYHAQLERTGAVKVMQAIRPDADTVARFRHEAQAIAKLRHPNIVDVYDFGEFEGTPYMIVEYIPGGSLASKMAEGTLDRTTALKYLRGIAAGLDYAHNHGIVHRDVKPANVLLTAEDSPVLADFGLAKLLQGSSLKSMTGMTTGTPAYMAPEQVTGTKVGPAADRYSLATIGYEMLTGVIPFDGEALMELLYAQVHREPPAPSWRNPSLGPRVDAVVMRGLSKDPAARWDSCAAFVDALGTALEPEPAAAVGATMVMAPPLASTVPLRAPAAVAARVVADPEPELATMATAYPSPPPVAPPKPRRRRSAIALIALGLILLLAVGSVVAWSVFNRPVTLSVTPNTVTAGDTVVVSASHVPPNTVGEVQLWSVERIVAFRSDSSGNVAVTLDIPRDLQPGDHLVKVCWRGSCHATETIHVIAPVAFTSPSPTAVASGSPTPTAPPSAHASPTPTATPTSTPCPTSSYSARLIETAAPSGPVLAGVSTVSIAGQFFTPNQGVTVVYSLKSLTQTSVKESWTRTVSCSGGFTVTFTPAAGDIGTATISARDAAGRIAYVSFSIT